MRLVDAEEIVKRCEDVIRHGVADNAGQHHISAECVMSVVKALPTVDAVPVRHGRWREDTGGYGFWICSHCGFVSEASAADLLYRYCPMCGAKMDGKDGDHHD